VAELAVVDDERIINALLAGCAAALLLLIVAGQPLIVLLIALALPVLIAIAARPQRGVLLLVLLLPFDGLQQILAVPDWVDGWKEALVLFTLLASFFAPRRVRGPARRPLPLWLAPLAIFAAIQLVSAGWLHDTQALIGLKINFFYVLAAFAAWRCPLSMKERDRLVSILMATGLVCAAYGIVQQLQGGNALLDMGYELDTNVSYIGTYLRSFSTFVQSQQFGLFMMVVLLMTIPAALAAPRRARNVAFFVLLPVYILGLLSSFSRGAVLGLGIGLVYLGFRRYRILLAALPLAAVALVVLNVLGGAAVTTFQDPSSFGERTTSWEENFEKIAEHPLGAGVGRSGAASEKAVELDVSGAAFQPDNYYFKTAYELGVLGLWVFVVFLVAVFCFLNIGAARGHSRDAPFLDGVAAFVLAAATASVVATFFEIYPMDAFFWVLLGIATSTIMGSKRRPERVSWQNATESIEVGAAR
jgi:putative inorganic carbon (hco3(-)) transporter